MREMTLSRTASSYDEIWMTEHPATYTLGLNRKSVRMPSRSDIPVIESDRGGKITYHGPGQLIFYVLLDLTRKHLTIRQLVSALEDAVIELLSAYRVKALARSDAPGVYVDGRKIASVGLRIKNGCCYHGLSLNVDMDLGPFDAIDPCGYQGLEVTQIKDLGIGLSQSDIQEKMISAIQHKLHYDEIIEKTEIAS
jgi:lipoyl(octanoyl) transferase